MATDSVLQCFTVEHFVDTCLTPHPLFDSAVSLNVSKAKMATASKSIGAVFRLVESFLADAFPFFVGSHYLTLAEVFPSHQMSCIANKRLLPGIIAWR